MERKTGHSIGRNLTGVASICLLVCSLVFCSVKQADAIGMKTVNVGSIANVISGVDKRDAKVALEIMVRKIVVRSFPSVQSGSVIYPSLKEAVKAVESEEVDIVTMLSTHYLEISDRNILQPKFTSSNGGEPGEKYVLLVKKECGFRALGQLRNKRLISQAGGSGVVSRMWLDTLLMERSFPENGLFFNSVKEVNKISMAVLPVFFGQADACLVSRHAYETMVELNPQVGRKLNVLHESPGYLVTVTCFRSGMDEKDKETLSVQFDTLDETPEFRQILILFHLEAAMRYKPEYLFNVEQLSNQYRRLKNGSKQGH